MSDADKANVPVLLNREALNAAELAQALPAVPAPGFPGGAEYAAAAANKLLEQAVFFTAAATSTSTGDMSKLKSLKTDLAAGHSAKAFAAMKTPAGVVAAAGTLPACAALGRK